VVGIQRPLRLRRGRKFGPNSGVDTNSCTQQRERFKNDVWTCDFIHDWTVGRRPLKRLTMVEEQTRECPVLHADESLTGGDVRQIVALLISRRGAPTRIRSDNGSEVIRAALTNWLPGVGAKSIPVAATSSWENRLHRAISQPIARWAPGTSGIGPCGVGPSQCVVVPPRIQHGEAAQPVGIRDPRSTARPSARRRMKNLSSRDKTRAVEFV
jgi:hypothetical protein